MTVGFSVECRYLLTVTLLSKFSKVGRSLFSIDSRDVVNQRLENSSHEKVHELGNIDLEDCGVYRV